MLASRSGVRGSRRNYEEKHNKAKRYMKFKVNYMNLIRFGESVRVGEARFFYHLNYRDIFTLTSNPPLNRTKSMDPPFFPIPLWDLEI